MTNLHNLHSEIDAHHSEEMGRPGDYARFALIILGIFLLTTAYTAIDPFVRDYAWMQNFMACFFLCFGLFKLISYPDFVAAYMTYDLIAQRSKSYAQLYPFLEIALGILLLFDVFPIISAIIILILMAIGAVGVIKVLRSKQKFICACLGTVIKIQVTYITLVENVTMGAMAIFIIITILS